jgi:drug/metabolite transporter (DMT)-like permease
MSSLPLIAVNAKAVAWVTLGTALFSIVFASGKLAGDIANPLQILFLRYVSGFLVLVCLVLLKGGDFKSYHSTRPASHFLRAVFGAYGGAAMIYAAAHMPIIEATAIGLLQSVFMVALGVIMLSERINFQQWVGIIFCCAGSVIIVAAQGAFTTLDMVYLIPAGFALLGAVLVAFEGIMIKKLAMIEKPMTVLLYVNFFGFILLGIPAYMSGQSVQFIENVPFLLLGPLAITAQYFIIKGYTLADVALLGAVDYTWLIFAGIIGYVFFAEIPTLATMLGSITIVVGGLILAMVRSNQNNP